MEAFSICCILYFLEDYFPVMEMRWILGEFFMICSWLVPDVCVLYTQGGTAPSFSGTIFHIPILLKFSQYVGWMVEGSNGSPKVSSWWLHISSWWVAVDSVSPSCGPGVIFWWLSIHRSKESFSSNFDSLGYYFLFFISLNIIIFADVLVQLCKECLSMHID